LRGRKDFQRVFKEGRRRGTQHFVIVWSRNDVGFSRIGAVARKKIGNAVERNRIKRLTREFFRRHKRALAPSMDYVIMGKQGVAALTYQEIRKELAFLLETNGIHEGNNRKGTREG
jgi:ribonuclease P protein component